MIFRTGNISNKRRILLCTTLLALAGGGLAACTPTVTQRGNMLEEYQIKEIAPGVHSRTDVLRLLGSPTTQAPFDDTVWYYIGETTEKRGVFDADTIEKRVVVVKFNNEGIVEKVAKVEDNNLDIPYERDKTPTHGNDITVLQQLLGNLGRFNPQQEAGK